MPRIKISYCLIALLLAVTSSYGQVDATLDQLRTEVPPSPNASSLGKFGEWPVSLYTGLPSIDIPIYTLKSRNLSVPISLDYHAAGIRVGEIASSVGLGWALNAGGCISRTVHGVPDDYNYFYTAHNFSDPNNFCSAPVNMDIYYQTQASGAQGNQDVEQDTYNLNVLGRSYRILFEADTVAYTMPASNIKITKNYITTSDSTWTLLLEDGTKLIFGGSSGSNLYNEETSGVTFGTDGGGSSYTSAWYLRSMTAPTGETITFTYTASGVSQDTHFTQSDNILYFYTALVAGNQGDAPFSAYNSISSRASLQSVGQLTLSTIQSDLATIYFIPNDTPRLDLKGGVALSEIKVLSKLTNTYVEDWTFGYTYTRCAPSNELIGNGTGNVPVDSSYFHYRLKLMNVSRNANSQPQMTWSFTYNPLTLPSRRSFAQDYWGFYNGATANGSLLSTIPFNPTVCPLVVDNYSAWTFTNVGFMNSLGDNHTPNAQYMQAEMLTNITYPTGGSTAFNFEANSIMKSQELFKNTGQPLYLNAFGGGSGSVVLSQTYTFVLTQPQYVNFTLTSQISQAILGDQPGAKVFAQILDNQGNQVVNLDGSGGGWYNIYQAGTYTLKLFTNCGQGEFGSNIDYLTATATLQYPNSLGFQNLPLLLGGLRINNVQSYDGISSTPVDAKYYVYDSAFVINPVDTVNSYITSQYVVEPSNGEGSQYEYMRLTRSCATKYSLGSIQGGTVGYGKVTTYDGLNGANGYTVSSFSCDLTSQAGLTAALQFPYPPNDLYEWRNGLLLSEINYTSAGLPVKATKNSYNFVQKARVRNFGDGFLTISAPLSCAGATYGACGTFQMCYSITNEQVEHVSTTNIDYSTAVGSLATTTWFYYDDILNMKPTRTETVDSKGDTVLTYSRSPLELAAINSSIPLTAAATTALDTMVARNIVGQPVESERYVGGTLSYKALTNYQVQPTGLVLPANVMLQNSIYPVETRVNFLEYDNYGNLLEQEKANDENHNYVYDYSGNYPIAEVINADSTSIAYTSFESNGSGNWTIASALRDPYGLTGQQGYNLSNGACSRAGLKSNIVYVVSYWSKTGNAFTVNGTTGTMKGKAVVINGQTWTYFEHAVTGVTSVSVSSASGGDVDELRLYPATAQMKTYTYSPLVGMTSACDADNRVTYYQYDALERLAAIMDQNGNIIKTYQYHYVGH